MQAVLITLLALGTLLLIGAGFCDYMLWRNKKVFEFTVHLLYNDFETYKRLPPYRTMMRRFWVWPLTRFVK